MTGLGLLLIRSHSPTQPLRGREHWQCAGPGAVGAPAPCSPASPPHPVLRTLCPPSQDTHLLSMCQVVPTPLHLPLTCPNPSPDHDAHGRLKQNKVFAVGQAKMRSRRWTLIQYACMHAQSLQLCLTLCDPMYPQTPVSMGFPRQEFWRGLPFPPPGDLPDSGIEPASPVLAGRFFTPEPPGKPHPI